MSEGFTGSISTDASKVIKVVQSAAMVISQIKTLITQWGDVAIDVNESLKIVDQFTLHEHNHHKHATVRAHTLDEGLEIVDKDEHDTLGKFYSATFGEFKSIGMLIVEELKNVVDRDDNGLIFNQDFIFDWKDPGIPMIVRRYQRSLMLPGVPMWPYYNGNDEILTPDEHIVLGFSGNLPRSVPRNKICERLTWIEYLNTLPHHVREIHVLKGG
jgi:hypothetical protein